MFSDSAVRHPGCLLRKGGPRPGFLKVPTGIHSPCPTLMRDPSDKIVGSDAVNEHLKRTIPRTLWHYTSFRGFQGIVSLKAVWATEYRFLNDREEFLHAKLLAERLAEEEPEYVANHFPARDILRKSVGMVFSTGYLHEERLRVMVASFTEEGGWL